MPKVMRAVLIVAFVAVLVGVGWLIVVSQRQKSSSSTTQNSSPIPPIPAPQNVPSLTLTALTNMTYHLREGTWAATVELVDGKEQVNSPLEGRGFWLDKKHVVFGDLDKDHTDGAMVVLINQGGGSGTFYYLVAVKNRDGKGETSAVRNLGDRIKINGINLRGGIVTVDMITQGPNDPMCCPTRREVLRLALRADQFMALQPRKIVEQEQQEQIANPPIIVPTSHAVNIGGGALSVGALQYKYFTLRVPAGAHNVTVQGHFTATGGGGNDIEVFLLDDGAFTNWKNHHQSPAYYNSGRITVGDVAAALPDGAATYYLVFNNTFSLLTPKAVEFTGTLIYDQ